MSKSFKFKNNMFLDSNSIIHKNGEQDRFSVKEILNSIQIKDCELIANQKFYINYRARGAYIVIINTPNNDMACGVYAVADNGYSPSVEGKALFEKSDYYTSTNLFKVGIDNSGLYIHFPENRKCSVLALGYFK